jgi:hypothetical protein
MNALELIREACSIVGISRPNSVTGSADTGVRQLLGLLNKEGRDLSARYAWQSLIREAHHTTVAAEDQGSITSIIVAANAYRYIVNETMWNRSRREPVRGPNSSLHWQALKTLDLSGPYTEYRIRGDHLLFTPVPAAGEDVYFEYVTKNWCTSADGEQQRAAISNDEDVFLLSDEIMLVGVEWRWRKAKGLAYSEDFATYERLVADAMARDATKRRIDMTCAKPAQRTLAVSPGSWPLS